MIADVVSEILDRRGITAPQTNVVGRLASLYAATPQPRIDGRITIADALSAAALMVTGSAIGIPAGAGAVLLSGDINTFPLVWGLFNVSTAALVGIRLLVDVLDPAGLISEVQLLRRFRKDYDAFREWHNEQRYGHPREIEHTIKVEVKDEIGNLQLLGFDAAQSQRVAEFAHKWLEVQSTVEKHFIGKNGIWSNGKGESGRDGWNVLKKTLFASGLAYENSNGTWDFLAAGKRTMERIASQYPSTPGDASAYSVNAGE